MPAGSWGQCEFFHSVDEVGTGVLARHRFNDECLVFKCDEASAETAVHVRKQSFKVQPVSQMQSLTERGFL